MRKRSTVLFGIVLPLYLLALTPAAQAQDGRHGEAGVLGSWQVQVTPTALSVCHGPALPVPPSFIELVTFDAGGGFHETNSHLNWNVQPLFPGVDVSASDGFGTWTKHAQTQVKFRKLLFDSTGAYFANVDVREILENAQHGRLSGKFTIEFDFLDGSPSLCGSGDVGGALIRPEE